MKYPTVTMGFACIILTCAISQGQMLAPTHQEQVEAMKQLKPMLGKWTGTGWIKMGPRQFDFESSEIFSEKAGGLAVFVEGLHQMPFPSGEKRVIHDAVAMINYDAESDRYRFATQLATGRSGRYWAKMDDDGSFRWIIPDTPVGKMEYKIKIEDDKYYEIGEIISESGERTQFFEMNLTRESE